MFCLQLLISRISQNSQSQNGLKPIKAALVSVLTSVSESDQTNEAEAELLHCFRTSESDQPNEAEAELLHCFRASSGI